MYADAAYGAGELLAYFGDNGVVSRVKVQPPVAPGGLFAKDRFGIDLAAGTVTCPPGNISAVFLGTAGAGIACFNTSATRVGTAR
ncbi:MAG: hypothetical protein M0005_14005 [Actinomycetota bacterium]|nr:hypothetical protein [Actinomycetota bacterium]